MRAARAVAVGAAALAVSLSACTGVPGSSQPQVVGPVGSTSASAPPIDAPPPNADPRTIVKGFLAANVSDDNKHTAARSFLTTQEKGRWSDTPVTVVDAETVGNFDTKDTSVTVKGRQVGSIDANGIYQPVVNGDGNGGDVVSFRFVLKQVDKQWRIDSLQNGVIVSDLDFQNSYQQRRLYFFDLSEQRLVPDPRYTSITDPSQLANWLVTQLAIGPRSDLAHAVTNQEMPAVTNPQLSVTIGGATTSIEVPGAAGQDVPTRNHLAAQLALTLEQATGAQPLTITDGGRPVTIATAGGTTFSPSTFPALDNPSSRAASVFYVRTDGAVLDEFGKPLAGAVGTGQYGLRTVAIASTPSTSDLLVAGTAPAGSGQQRLWVGTQHGGLHQTAVTGSLSRPAWVPDLDEAWVGDGSTLYRTSSRGGATKVLFTNPSFGKVPGRVTALRFSPDGSRLAMVIASQQNTSQVYVGSVVRNGDDVHVDSVQPISPLGVVATDVAWNDPLKLFLIGKYASTEETNVFEVQVDGSLWTPRSTVTLPGPPDSITVAENAPAWVSVAQTVWEQRGSTWASPVGDPTPGNNPVYLE